MISMEQQRESSSPRLVPTLLALLLITTALAPLAMAQTPPQPNPTTPTLGTTNAAPSEDTTPSTTPQDPTSAPVTPSGVQNPSTTPGTMPVTAATVASPTLKGPWVPQVLSMSRCSPPAVVEGMRIVCESDLVPACCGKAGNAMVCVTGVAYGAGACPEGYTEGKACCK